MAGPRIFTVEEIDALIPELESKFIELDGLRNRLRTLKIRVDALEMIWGEQVNRDDCSDNKEYLHHIEDMKSAEDEFQKTSASFQEFGATVKGLNPGLLDFYGVRDGFLVYLCWRRGESNCEYWHHIDTGFAGRQRL
ncbi:MAG: DUF2203 domain-containing protein [Planctomycetes bacterium]|nr:DUF2203 domain-containing protein [Planctomycetota bacterium]